ncbi:hypothetical protein TEA_014031 [Camellia sinensis var. sinensis]|uniref:Tyrosine specific protein phosphatases domain-containing protein n=1 Tax=Camellia sinensis var. sinensis TaxID=542762 RepID=A0A4S4DKU9_CAMSN|nr:hypothetical protein TEA_014031 [Camellia sinensis var. sinensis]
MAPSLGTPPFFGSQSAGKLCRCVPHRSAVSSSTSSTEMENADAEEEKSEIYSHNMTEAMGAVLTYKHELGMNYNFIRPDLIVGSCLQTPYDVDKLRSIGVKTIFCLQQDSDLEYFGVDITGIREYADTYDDIQHLRAEIRIRGPRSKSAQGGEALIHDSEAPQQVPIIIPKETKVQSNELDATTIVRTQELKPPTTSPEPKGPLKSEVEKLLSEFSNLVPIQSYDEPPPVHNIEHTSGHIQETKLLNLAKYESNLNQYIMSHSVTSHDSIEEKGKVESHDDILFEGQGKNMEAKMADMTGTIRIEDFDAFDLRMQLPAVVSKLHKAISRNGGVTYIHCTAGLGRAPAVALAHMFWFDGYKLSDGHSLLLSKRLCCPKLDAIKSATADIRMRRKNVNLKKLGLRKRLVTLTWKGSNCSTVEVSGLDIGWGQRMPLKYDNEQCLWILQRKMLVFDSDPNSISAALWKRLMSDDPYLTENELLKIRQFLEACTED